MKRRHMILLSCVSAATMTALSSFTLMAGQGDGETREDPPESVAHCVQNYGGPLECGSANLPEADNFCNVWANHFDVGGSYGYYQYEEWEDREVDHVDFVSKDYRDPYGTDFADAVFFFGHGNYTCDTSDKRSRFVMGDSANGQDCTAETNEIQFGDSDANAFVTFSCMGFEYCISHSNQYRHLRGASQFNVYNAMRGISWSGEEQRGDFDDYLDVAANNGIGFEWVDEMTRMYRGSYDGNNCAVFVTWASNWSDFEDHALYSGFKDFHNTGDTNHYYLEDPNCVPDYPGSGPTCSETSCASLPCCPGFHCCDDTAMACKPDGQNCF